MSGLTSLILAGTAVALRILDDALPTADRPDPTTGGPRTPHVYPQPNLFRLPPEDEAMIREHHATDGGYERCVICRLLATIDYEREDRGAAAALPVPPQEAIIEAAIDVAMQRGGDAALRANGLAVTSRRAMDRLVEALTAAGRTTPSRRATEPGEPVG